MATTADVCANDKLPANLDIVDQMSANGLDLERPREITQLFLGLPARLAGLEPILARVGYRVSIDRVQGRLIAAKDLAVTKEWVRSAIPQMCSAAAQNHVNYDGWDVDVSADHIQAN